MHFIFGLLGVGVCYLLIRYKRTIIGFTGPWGWAEKYLGGGRSETALVLIAIIGFFFSITTMTGLLDDIMKSLLGSFIQK